jgi:hypothetical protein
MALANDDDVIKATVADTAMPMAPPRLLMSAKRPLADFRRSGGKLPIVNVTVDAIAKGTAMPRKANGSSISSQPH